MAGTLFYDVYIEGAALDPALIPAHLLDRVKLTVSRGLVPQTGQHSDVSVVGLRAQSIGDAVSILGQARASQPEGIERAQIHLDFAYLDQCNLELHPAELAQLADARVAFTLSCWHDNSSAEDQTRNS